jgi:hypothetical protein
MGIVLPADASAYSARLRWQPSADPTVMGYHVYMSRVGGSWGQPQDVGMPVLAGDGTLSTVETGLDTAHDWAFAVVAYTASMESALSNEIDLMYAQVAPVVDSDGDGLTDAQEDRNLNRVVDPGETDPHNPDTDGDGVGDLQDWCQGTARNAAVNAVGCSCAQITCDDGNPCNGVETCSAGVCGPGTVPTCDDGNPCTTDACSRTSGCTHTPIAGCTACTSAGQCDDGNPCTADTCTGGNCQHAAVSDGTACSDGNVCNGAETCRAGVCRAGTALSCDDGNPCTTDSCDATRGCVHTNNTAPCADDGNPCTSDVCGGGSCTHPRAPNGTTCEDGLFCTIGDSCQAGVCRGGGANCTQYTTACRSGSCDESRRQCFTTPRTDGTDCSDGNVCNGTETCQAGVCTSAGAIDCDDGNPCTADSCDPVRGCQHTAASNGTSCSNGIFCDGDETCQAGTCTPGAPRSCDDGLDCTVDSCSESRQQCVHQSDACGCHNDRDCASSDACTTNHRCESGQCVSDPVVCPGSGPCAQATCDPANGCTVTPLTDLTPCEDGNPCTSNTVCLGGTCRAPQADAVGAAPETLTLQVKKFVLQPRGRHGMLMVARGAFEKRDAMEPDQTGVTVEIDDPQEDALYTATVPANLFSANYVRTRYLYVAAAGDPASTNGLQRLKIITGRAQTIVAAKGFVPATVAAQAPAVEAATSRGDAALTPMALAWTVRLGSRWCITNPVSCPTRGRWLRCR